MAMLPAPHQQHGHDALQIGPVRAVADMDHLQIDRRTQTLTSSSFSPNAWATASTLEKLRVAANSRLRSVLGLRMPASLATVYHDSPLRLPGRMNFGSNTGGTWFQSWGISGRELLRDLFTDLCAIDAVPPC